MLAVRGEVVELMSYVKLVARPDTWFKAGTEVYHYDAEPTRRLTLEEWNDWFKHGMVLVSGIRVIENPGSEGGGQIGEERRDGELCSCDEFDVEIVEEAR